VNTTADIASGSNRRSCGDRFIAVLLLDLFPA
jgi:hypothetical protein